AVGGRRGQAAGGLDTSGLGDPDPAGDPAALADPGPEGCCRAVHVDYRPPGVRPDLGQPRGWSERAPAHSGFAWLTRTGFLLQRLGQLPRLGEQRPTRQGPAATDA